MICLQIYLQPWGANEAAALASPATQAAGIAGKSAMSSQGMRLLETRRKLLASQENACAILRATRDPEQLMKKESVGCLTSFLTPF